MSEIRNLKMPSYVSHVRAAKVHSIDFVYAFGNYVFKSARIALSDTEDKIIGYIEVEKEYLDKNMPIVAGGYYVCSEDEEFWLPGHVFKDRYQLDEPI